MVTPSELDPAASASPTLTGLSALTALVRPRARSGEWRRGAAFGAQDGNQNRKDLEDWAGERYTDFLSPPKIGGILGEIKSVHPSEIIGIRAHDCVGSERQYVTL